MSKSRTSRKLTGSIVTIVILAICLCITTIALVYATISVENNLFHTGKIAINLNDGKPVIEEHEFLFEPGMTVEKEFFLENDSTWDVYYRIYLDEISGGLSDVLEVTIKDGEKVLYTGTANNLIQSNVSAADDVLQLKERKVLKISFHFPEENGNEVKNMRLNFRLCAEATQTKNNPDKLFD